MAIRLVCQTISPHTISQAIVCSKWPFVWYARLLAPILFVRPVFFYRMAICLVRQTISPQTNRQASVFYRMAIRLVRQTINRHTIRQASVFTE
jgi:hypothetical protein